MRVERITVKASPMQMVFVAGAILAVVFFVCSVGSADVSSATDNGELSDGEYQLEAGDTFIVNGNTYTAAAVEESGAVVDTSSQITVSGSGTVVTLTSGSLNMVQGATVTIRGDVYTALSDGAVIKYYSSDRTVVSGSFSVSSTDATVNFDIGASVVINDITITNTSDTDTISVTIFDSGLSRSVYLGDTTQKFTAQLSGSTLYSSEDIPFVRYADILIEDDGSLSVARSETISLANGVSVKAGSTTITGNWSEGVSKLTVLDSVATLSSGVFTLSGDETEASVLDYIVMGATDVTLTYGNDELEGASITTSGQDSFLSLVDGNSTSYNYSNTTSGTLTLSYSLQDYLFYLSAGSAVIDLNEGEEIYLNGYYISPGGADSITMTATSDTVTISSGTVISIVPDINSTWYCTAVSDSVVLGVESTGIVLESGTVSVPETSVISVGAISVSCTLASGTATVTSDGLVTLPAAGDSVTTSGVGATFNSSVADTVVQVASDGSISIYTQSSVSLQSGASFAVSGNTYTVPENSTATVSITAGAVTLESGSISVPAGGSVEVGTVSVINRSASDSVTIPYDLTAIALADGDVLATDGVSDSTYTSSGQSTVSIDSSGIISVTDTASSITLSAGESIFIESLMVTAVTESVISVAGGTLSITSGSLELASGNYFEVTVNTAVNSYSVVEASKVTVADGTVTLTEGTVAALSGASITVGDITITTAESDISIPFSLEGITLQEGTTISTDGPTVDDTLTTSTSIQVNILSSGDIELAEGTVVLSEGDKITVGETEFIAINNDSAVTVDGSTVSASGWVTLSGELRSVQLYGSVTVTGASAVSDDYVTAPAGGSITLAYSGCTATYANTSADTLNFTYSAGFYYPDDTTYTFTAALVPDSSYQVDNIVFTNDPSSSKNITLGRETAGSELTTVAFASAGDTVSFSDPSTDSVEGSYEATGTDIIAVDSSGNISIVNGSLSLAENGTVVAGGYTFTATVGDTSVTVADSVLTLDSGSLLVPAGASCFVGGVKVTNTSAEGTIALSSDMEVVLDTGESINTVGGSNDRTYSATAAVTVAISSTAVITVSEADSISLEQYKSLFVGNTIFTAFTDSTFSVSGGVATLSEGEVTIEAADSSGTTEVVVAGYTIEGATGAIVSDTATRVQTGTDGTLTIESDRTYVNASSEDLVLALETGAAASQFVLYSGFYKIFDGGQATVNGQTVSFQSVGEDAYAGVGTVSVLAFTGGTVTIGSASFEAGIDSTVLDVIDSSTVSLSSGTVTVPTSNNTLTIGDAVFSVESEVTVNYDGTTITLQDGVIGATAETSVAAGGYTYALSDSAYLSYSDGVVTLDGGSLSTVGATELTVGDIGFSVTGSGTAATFTAGDSILISIESGTGLSVTYGSVTFSYLVTAAELGAKLYSADNSTAAKVILWSGSATLGSGSEMWALLEGQAESTEYIKFDQPSVAEAVTVTVTEDGPRVTVGQGSINLTTSLDPTYSNAGTTDLVFLANDENDITLESGTVSVPEGSTVTVGDVTVTNTSGEVSVTDAGVVKVSAGSSAYVENPIGGYEIDNTSGTEEVTEDVIQTEESSSRGLFESAKDDAILTVSSYSESAYTQALADLITKHKAIISNLIYDASKTYSENTAAVDALLGDFESQWDALYVPDGELFEKYQSSVVTQLETLHIGETSLTEKRIIDNALSEVSSVTYDDSITLKENMAVLDSIVASVSTSLAKYRGDPSSAFTIYKAVMVQYVDTQPTSGIQAISDLITSYKEALDNLQYLSSQSSDDNLARIEELVDTFDGAVYQIHLSNFNTAKASVVTQLASMTDSYSEPEALAYISAVKNQLDNYAYDDTLLYSDNLSRLSNLVANLKSDIAAALSGNLSTFDSYCGQYKTLYEEAKAKYEDTNNYPEMSDDMRQDIVDKIDEAIGLVDRESEGRLEYDHALSLAQNIEAIHKVASDLSDYIKDKSSEELKSELQDFYKDAMTHFEKNDVDGMPSKVLGIIDAARTEVTAMYEQYKADPPDTQEEIDAMADQFNGIMVQYDEDIQALSGKLDFYYNLDRGEEFLREKYSGSGDTVTAMMETYIAELMAMEYDGDKTLEENLAAVQEKVNGYSIALSDLRAKTVMGDFENYRDYAAWKITSLDVEGITAGMKDLIDTYASRISAMQYNYRSLYSNKVAVDEVYAEFESRYLPLTYAAQRDLYVANLENELSGLSDSLRAKGAAYLSDLKAWEYSQDGDSAAELARIYNVCVVKVEFLKASTLTASTSTSSASNEYFMSCWNDMVAQTPVSAAAVSARAAGITEINAIIISSEYDQAAKAERISAIYLGFLSMMEFDDAVSGALADMESVTFIGQSDKLSNIISKYSASISAYQYDDSKTADENIAAVEAIYGEFAEKFETQRLLENTMVTGMILTDGRGMDGQEPEYPEGCTEIWGSVGNVLGIGSAPSIKIESTTPADMSGNVMAAEGSKYNFLADGNVLGAFEITLYDNGTEVTEFNGRYLVRILLPAEMRGDYDTVQVAYVDEYGDVQIHDAKIVGKYLEFYTTHFSLFTLIGANDVQYHYDAYAYAVIAVLLVLLFAYLSRIVRYDGNGGAGSTQPQFFIGDGEGVLSGNGFTREGHRFAGWSRTPEGGAEFAADSRLEELGKFHSIKLFAVWEKEDDQ